jgi:hypothetical protein
MPYGSFESQRSSGADQERLKLDRAQIKTHIEQLQMRKTGAESKGDLHAADVWADQIKKKRQELMAVEQKLAA